MLSGIVLPHAVFFGYAVGVIELLIGISLLLGLWVRPASVFGILFLLNLTLASWWDAGHGVPVWHYFGARLDTYSTAAVAGDLFRRGRRNASGGSTDAA